MHDWGYASFQKSITGQRGGVWSEGGGGVWWEGLVREGAVSVWLEGDGCLVEVGGLYPLLPQDGYASVRIPLECILVDFMWDDVPYITQQEVS